MSFTVNVAVCGRFHYHNYIPFLAQEDFLKSFYYSHRFDRKILKDHPEKEVNLWLKEYLRVLHSKVFGTKYQDSLFYAYLLLWEKGVLKHWRKADLWHLLLHGTALKILQRAKNEGSLTLGEAVNAHPLVVFQILSEEEERLSLPRRQRLWKAAQRLLEELKEIDFLLVPSNWVKKSFIQEGFPEEKIQILHYGVNVSRFKPSQSKDNVFRVICVAQITPRKGQVYLLEAWKKLKLPHAELCLAGKIDPVMIPLLSRYNGLFRYLGYSSHEKVASFYQNASVYVLPTLEDGFAVSCLEAMASGLPVVTTDQNGASDVIKHGVNGFVVPIRSPEKIAYYLELLYTHPGLCREMGEKAAYDAQHCYNWESYARKLVKIYEEIMGVKICP
ncbi:glycosyltransferase family 4 protein [Candidatus Methylacidiphilum infernorum]|uniref:Glycosyltransferase family 4 protein n=1 Tax=Candidatus Methylacidiphilum infernorum TaxID=511746 RepID=A0ABX7PUS6_9BACT|nr:glycosyltransferase family 4 protein [Candidatus Methylacidiphilum infernorum]QSR86416.1 glycosyltransferase family 4 protein [Candidatus Methylacidiphilum infernorum]